MKETNQNGLELLPQLSNNKEVIDDVLEKYTKYVVSYSWIRNTVVIFIIMVLLYNIFIAGKRYPIEEYNLIRNATFFIVGLFLVAVVGIGIYTIKRYSEVTSVIKNISMTRQMNYKKLKKEFNILLKSIGGPGI